LAAKGRPIGLFEWHTQVCTGYLFIGQNMIEQSRKIEILDAIRAAAKELGVPLPRSRFLAHSGLTEYRILKYFPSWRAALRAAGLEPDNTNISLEDEELLRDWGELVRILRQIPTRDQYRREGDFGANSFANHFGPWSTIPQHFRRFAEGKHEWADVLTLFPANHPRKTHRSIHSSSPIQPSLPVKYKSKHAKMENRPTYGDPIDFRGLRHEPVNEGGVIFLFGKVARELGYYVEAVQAGYPDCEAKRQIGPGKWQRVKIEFEYESRNFRDHGHSPGQCDIIVCWRHNWPECPEQLEVMELRHVIQQLAKSDD
jgi:hypothetical protein